MSIWEFLMNTEQLSQQKLSHWLLLTKTWINLIFLNQQTTFMVTSKCPKIRSRTSASKVSKWSTNLIIKTIYCSFRIILKTSQAISKPKACSRRTAVWLSLTKTSLRWRIKSTSLLKVMIQKSLTAYLKMTNMIIPTTTSSILSLSRSSLPGATLQMLKK